MCIKSKEYRKMNWDANTPFLVIVNYYDNDISWVDRLKFPHVVYYKEKEEKEPFTAKNKAKSETNLLKFIVDFYDSLPQNVIIVRQYEKKFYHEGSLVDILNDPDFVTKYKESKSKGFWNFNNQKLGSIIPQRERMIKSGWWPKCMEPYFGFISGCGDFTLEKKGYAQFVVSRERIHSLPKDFYNNMYNWLVENTLDEEDVGYDPVTLIRKHTNNWEHPNSSHHTSRYMEWSWELIFASWKPSEDITVLLPDGRKIYAIYGSNNYYRDVTDLVISHCLDKTTNKIDIPPSLNFNETFGDPLYGSVKTLRIVIDGKLTEISESRHILI